MIGEPSDPCGNIQTRECVGPCTESCARYPSKRPMMIDNDGNIVERNSRLNPKMIEKKELNKGEFALKIMQPEGFMVLIEDFYEGRFELHVYRRKDMVIYVSPVILDMETAAANAFTNEVHRAALRKPDQIRCFQW